MSRQGQSIRGHELFGRTNAVCSFRCLDRLRGAAASDVQGLDVGGFDIRVAGSRIACSRPSRARGLRRAQGCLRTSRVPTMLQVLLSIARRSQGAYQPIGPSSTRLVPKTCPRLFATRPVIRANTVISSNSPSCPGPGPYRRAPPCNGGALVYQIRQQKSPFCGDFRAL